MDDLERERRWRAHGMKINARLDVDHVPMIGTAGSVCVACGMEGLIVVLVDTASGGKTCSAHCLNVWRGMLKANPKMSAERRLAAKKKPTNRKGTNNV